MASIILAQKLLSVKLTKEEFDKVLSLKVNNEENKFKMIPYLKKVTNGQVHNKTCRLCLKPGRHNIFDKYEFDYVGTIKHILQIEVNENDRKPQHICTACKTTLKEAEQLKHTAEVTQWRLQQELEMVTCTLMDYERNDNSHHGGFFTEQGTREWICRKCRQSFNNQKNVMQTRTKSSQSAENALRNTAYIPQTARRTYLIKCSRSTNLVSLPTKRSGY